MNFRFCATRCTMTHGFTATAIHKRDAHRHYPINSHKIKHRHKNLFTSNSRPSPSFEAGYHRAATHWHHTAPSLPTPAAEPPATAPETPPPPTTANATHQQLINHAHPFEFNYTRSTPKPNPKLPTPTRNSRNLPRDSKRNSHVAFHSSKFPKCQARV